jgi:hypothetical protein
MSKKLNSTKGNGTSDKKGKATKTKTKKKPSLEEMLYRAWKKTYENRHQRLVCH